MTPEGRLQAVLDLLEEIAQSPRPADGTASDFFRDRRFIGSKDRRDIADRVWGVLRRWMRLAWHVRAVMADIPGIGKPPRLEQVPPRHRVIADLVLTNGMGLTGLDGLFTGERFAPRALNEMERWLVKDMRPRRLNDHDMPLWIRGEVPEWLAPRLERVYGQETIDVLASLDSEAPTDLRVNTLKGGRTEAVVALALEEVAVSETTLSPHGLRLAGRANLPSTKVFRNGLVEVQDEGSQMVALLAGVKPGMAVIDLCAGAGGKTLALAAEMQNKGRLVACDVSEGRLERSGVRLKRAGVHNVTRHVLDAEGNRWLKRQAGGFDRVLVDAPCSGTGTWRRNPDARWRLTQQAIADLSLTQAELIQRGADLVKPGGRLVYATCSLMAEENEDQIAAFLAAHDDFRVIPVATLWEATGSPSPCPVTGDYLRLDPFQHNTDGFFVAVLEKAKVQKVKAENPTPEATTP